MTPPTFPSDLSPNSQSAPATVEGYKHAMRRVVSPVAVVTYCHRGEWAGLTATAICSATTAPPTILACVNRNKVAAGRIRETGAFAVNFLTDEQSDIARRFSSSAAGGEELFGTGEWRQGANRVPILEGAVASFDCTLEKVVQQGEHDVFFGRVVATQVAQGNSLLYRDGFFRRLNAE